MEKLRGTLNLRQKGRGECWYKLSPEFVGNSVLPRGPSCYIMKGRLRGTVERMTRPAAPPAVDDQPGHSAPARSIQVPLCPPVCELQRLRSSSPRIVPGTPTPYNDYCPTVGPHHPLDPRSKGCHQRVRFRCAPRPGRENLALHRPLRTS